MSSTIQLLLKYSRRKYWPRSSLAELDLVKTLQSRTAHLTTGTCTCHGTSAQRAEETIWRSLPQEVEVKFSRLIVLRLRSAQLPLLRLTYALRMRPSSKMRMLALWRQETLLMRRSTKPQSGQWCSHSFRLRLKCKTTSEQLNTCDNLRSYHN